MCNLSGRIFFPGLHGWVRSKADTFHIHNCRWNRPNPTPKPFRLLGQDREWIHPGNKSNNRIIQLPSFFFTSKFFFLQVKMEQASWGEFYLFENVGNIVVTDPLIIVSCVGSDTTLRILRYLVSTFEDFVTYL